MPENRDTISREAAKNALCQLCRDISNWRMCERNDECNLICRIDGVPAADVVSGKDFRDCRNELCIRCGNYKQRHLGACDGCRWKERGNG